MNVHLSTLPKYSILIMLVAMTSCKNEKLDPSRSVLGYEYFPLATGQWTEYQVDSIVHLDIDDAFELDTAIRYYSYQVREVVDTPFTDAENEQAFVILRYRRDNDSLPWSFSGLWTAKVTSVSAQRVEDNIRFVRMKFPIKSGDTWNGNAYNFFPMEEYTYEDLYVPGQWGSLYFDSTVTVLQNEFVSNINRVYKKEIYAAGTGLVFKQLDSVKTTITPNGVIILNGTEYSQVITSYKQ